MSIRPVKYSGSSITDMTDAEMDYAANRILERFASSLTGAGTINMTPTPVGRAGTGTAIGSFIDTKRDAEIGDHPVGTTVLSTTTTFYQDINGVSVGTLTRPVRQSGTVGVGVISEQTLTNLYNNIIDRALQRLVNGGMGVYTLQVTAPTTGGTWVQVAVITNTSLSGNNTTTLWRRVSEGTPTVVRPLKAVTGGLREMSDEDIKSLTTLFLNRMYETGIGQYRVQASAPTTGTWIRQGNIFYDTRQEVGDVSYAGSYTGGFSGTYTGYYTGYYVGSRNHTYAGWYTGWYSRSFTGTYVGNYTRYYSGVAYGTYTGYYTGYYVGFFAGSYKGYYTGTYTNYAGYQGSYAGEYTGTYSSEFAGNYTGATVLETLENASNISLWLRTA